MPNPTQALDHLILFLPVNPTTNLPSVPPSLTSNFTLTPGGFHADGATSNILILLADGLYIELISFLHPSAAPTHWWGPDASFTGWKDWCLTNTSTPEDSYQRVKETHAEPVHGGRKRADGVDVKWAVTFPKGEMGGQGVRGRVPFFCHDVTPRGVRVAIDGEKTTHACGALGVRGITVVVKDQGLLDETRRSYASILGDEGMVRDDGVEFRAGRVIDVEGLDGGAKIILRLPKSDEESKQVEKLGFWYGDVVLGAKARPGKTAGTKKRLDSSEGEDSVRGLWIEHV
ncbi:Nn.00g043910.m01.CDS01 [Neocucurbitaria sp. VM-36]